MGRLNGKVAIVTGGASGIGESTVREMVKEGARVVIADINDKLGQHLSEELNVNGANVIYQSVNVTNEEEVEKLVRRAISEFGKLDILFNNAGVGSMTPTTELSFEEWNRIISVNLNAVFLVGKHALRAMKKSGGGSIVNNASILGNVGEALTAAYCASKGGVVNITKALAVEFAKENIRVNTVSPGYIDTPFLVSADPEFKKGLISLHPIGRLGKPREVAKAVVFLASDDASFITGANLVVDGGYTAR